MAIEFDDSIVGVWFIEHGTEDWMAGINKFNDGSFSLKYRFRYYAGEDAWDKKDVKNWYAYRTTSPKEEVIATVRMLVEKMTSIRGGKTYELIREEGESVDSFMDKFTKLPFVHLKVVEPGDPEYEEFSEKDQTRQ